MAMVSRLVRFVSASSTRSPLTLLHRQQHPISTLAVTINRHFMFNPRCFGVQLDQSRGHSRCQAFDEDEVADDYDDDDDDFIGDHIDETETEADVEDDTDYFDDDETIDWEGQ